MQSKTVDDRENFLQGDRYKSESPSHLFDAAGPEFARTCLTYPIANKPLVTKTGKKIDVDPEQMCNHSKKLILQLQRQFSRCEELIEIDKRLANAMSHMFCT